MLPGLFAPVIFLVVFDIKLVFRKSVSDSSGISLFLLNVSNCLNCDGCWGSWGVSAVSSYLLLAPIGGFLIKSIDDLCVRKFFIGEAAGLGDLRSCF